MTADIATVSLAAPAATQAPRPDHADAAIVIPCIEVERLTVRCVEECYRLFSQAEIIVLADLPANAEAIADKAKVIVTGRVTISAKRNRGARDTRRPIVAFIDSDAFPAATWLDNAVRALREHPEAAAAAGPNVSPLQESRSERYVGVALMSRICSNNAHYVKRPNSERLVSNMPSSNLVVRRDEYLAMGGMDESLAGGEDVEFCHRLTLDGRRILYRKEILVYHKNRRFSQYVLQRMAIGAQSLIGALSRPSLVYFTSLLPAAMVLFLLTGSLLPWLPAWEWIYLPVVGLYLAAIVTEALRHAKRLSDVPGGLAGIVVGTLAPGVGTIAYVCGVLPEIRRIWRNDR